MTSAEIAPPAPFVRDGHEFTTVDFLHLLIRRWWLVIAGALAGLFLASLYLSAATYKHTAELQVSAVQQQGSGMLSRLGGLAGVAGLDLKKSARAIPFDFYLEAVFSAEIARVLSEDDKIMRGAFRKEWRDGRWQPPEGGGLARSVKQLLGIRVAPWTKPDARRLGDWIEKQVNVSQSNNKVLVAISLEDEDPEFAAYFLNRLHETTDRVIRAKTLDRTSGTIAYLSRKLGEVTLAEHRTALADALGEEERERMMAAVNTSFAAERFGEIRVSTEPTSPKALVVIGIGLIAGTLTGILGALAYHLLRSRPAPPGA